MRISDWSSDVCSSDLLDSAAGIGGGFREVWPQVINKTSPSRAVYWPHCRSRGPAPKRLLDRSAGRRPPLPRMLELCPALRDASCARNRVIRLAPLTHPASPAPALPAPPQPHPAPPGSPDVIAPAAE